MKSLWQDTVQMPRFESLKGDIHTDVLIIGGGIAGILTASYLHQNGVKYVLVEKERICSGTTQNTTAKITYQHGLNYHQIIKRYGMLAAQQYLTANQRAFEKYADLSRTVDCDYEEKDNYVYSTNDQKKLDDEMEALNRIGYQAELCEKPDIPITTMGAVKFPCQAQFHPLKFLSAVATGLNICEHTFVREMIGNTAITDHGTIRANHIIVTTHFPFINKHGSYFLKLYQHRSYVIALDNAQDVGGMFVDESKAGLSFRDHGDLLLLGGGGHRTGHKGGDWSVLRKFAQNVYPHATEQYCWAAQDCMSLDSIPYIGQYSKRTHRLFVASGFNKWGMTGAMTAAMILTDKILGKHNDCADVFDPSRGILKPQLLVNGFEATKNLLTISEKRCPHLGCALKYNRTEHSWDCACHGSRFNESGKVLNNPANGDLK